MTVEVELWKVEANGTEVLQAPVFQTKQIALLQAHETPQALHEAFPTILERMEWPADASPRQTTLRCQTTIQRNQKAGSCTTMPKTYKAGRCRSHYRKVRSSGLTKRMRRRTWSSLWMQKRATFSKSIWSNQKSCMASTLHIPWRRNA